PPPNNVDSRARALRERGTLWLPPGRSVRESPSSARTAKQPRRMIVTQARPVVLAVEREKGALREASRLLQSRYRIVTCPVESVALEFLSESRPAAVLFDAAALYLDGAPLVERWRQAA